MLKSTPDGADVNIDGKYVGSTPSTFQVSVGEHAIRVGMAGYNDWQRTVSVQAGSTITVNATLEKK